MSSFGRRQRRRQRQIQVKTATRPLTHPFCLSLSSSRMENCKRMMAMVLKWSKCVQVPFPAPRYAPVFVDKRTRNWTQKCTGIVTRSDRVLSTCVCLCSGSTEEKKKSCGNRTSIVACSSDPVLVTYVCVCARSSNT